MNLKRLVALAANKANFTTIPKYVDFCNRYLEFVETGLQATIVSQNETHYRFLQYKKDGHFNITRPINSQLMYDASAANTVLPQFETLLANARDIAGDDAPSRAILCNSIYTIQQSIGAALDALPSGQSNTARKINGDLFERLIRLLIVSLGVDCTTGTIHVPVKVDGVEQFRMGYQHDLIIREGNVIKAIGGVKTSSKDRIDKIFMDKFLYCKLTETCLPHIAVFLNDVQRANTKIPRKWRVSGTFLPGHFRGYTVKLNPLDGVYYCDPRPNMLSDGFLKNHIKTIDHFFCTDLWNFVRQPGAEGDIASRTD